MVGQMTGGPRVSTRKRMKDAGSLAGGMRILSDQKPRDPQREYMERPPPLRLDFWGSAGWELVTSYLGPQGNVFIFKRKRQ